MRRWTTVCQTRTPRRTLLRCTATLDSRMNNLHPPTRAAAAETAKGAFVSANSSLVRVFHLFLFASRRARALGANAHAHAQKIRDSRVTPRSPPLRHERTEPEPEPQLFHRRRRASVGHAFVDVSSRFARPRARRAGLGAFAGFQIRRHRVGRPHRARVPHGAVVGVRTVRSESGCV